MRRLASSWIGLLGLGLVHCGGSSAESGQDAARAGVDAAGNHSPTFDASTSGDVAVSSAEGSSANSCPVPELVPPQLPACDPRFCGNGTLDTCSMGCAPQINCPPAQTEACDGENLAGATCSSVGYASGTLACASTCQLDDRACVSCAPAAGPVLSCRRACVDGSAPVAIAIAATGTTLGLAWLTTTTTMGHLVHFALLDRDLDVTAEAPPWPFASTGPYDDALAVAPSPSGWLVAVRQADLTVYPFDTNAHAAGSPHAIPGGVSSSFGWRPGGAPLLAWPELNDAGGLTLRAAIVGDDARFQTAPVDLFGDAESHTGTSIIPVDGGFLVAHAANQSIVTTRVGTDGKASGVTQNPAGQLNEAPEFALVSGQIALMYTSFNPAESASPQKWALLDSSGASVAAPTPITPLWPSYQSDLAFQVVGVGADALLLYTSWESGGGPVQLTIAHLDTHGTAIGTPHMIARVPMATTHPYRIVSLADKAVVAFVDGHSIDLAAVSLGAP
jgi:hypothetical protein